MASTTRHHVDVGDILPMHTVTATGGTTVQLRPSVRRATILVFTHGAECSDCKAYVRRLTDEAATLSRWDATALLIGTGSGGGADAVTDDGGPFRAVEDPRSLREKTGVAPDAAAVMVTDRHGEVWEAVRTADHHDLPSVDELEQTVRFIAIQCPECEVPDSPG